MAEIKWDAEPSNARGTIVWDAQPEQRPAALAGRTGLASIDIPDAVSNGLKYARGFAQGMADPVVGAVQLGANLLSPLAPKQQTLTGLVTGEGPKGFGDRVNAGIAANEAKQQQLGTSGGARLAGNVLAPTNALGASWLKGATTAGQMVLRGAAMGAAQGAAAPVLDGNNYWGNKGTQVAIGTVAGGAIPAAGNAVARVVMPKAASNPALATLEAEGVKPTIGQTLGGAWNAMEEKAQSIPFVGDMIAKARRNAVEQFNNAAINRAVAPIGAKVEGSGFDAVRKAGDALSDGYKQALDKVKYVRFDGQFQQDLQQLMGMAQNLEPSLAGKFQKLVSDKVMSQASNNGSMLGQTFKNVDSELGTIARRYQGAQSAMEKDFGDAVAQLQSLLGDQMRRSNPHVSETLNALDRGWANLVRVEGAAKAAANREGVFTPAQLQSAVRAADSSARDRATARGTALMQDLARAANSTIANKVPDSGTTGRALASGLLGAGAVIQPAIAGGIGVGSLLYTSPAQALLRALVTRRPALAGPLAQQIEGASPMLAPAGVRGLLND